MVDLRSCHVQRKPNQTLRLNHCHKIVKGGGVEVNVYKCYVHRFQLMIYISKIDMCGVYINEIRRVANYIFSLHYDKKTG